jgi:hypothetical protein
MLPDDVRDSYRMFALERLDHATIAARLGIPRATVGTRIHRARRHLRAALTARVATVARIARTTTVARTATTTAVTRTARTASAD